VEIKTCTGSSGAENVCPESETWKFIFNVTD